MAEAPGPGTYPVDVFYANVNAAAATQVLVVNGATATPMTVELSQFIFAGGGDSSLG